MAAILTPYLADGTTEITDGQIPGFGVVVVGTTTPVTTIVIRNTGDTTAYNLEMRIVQDSTSDGALIGSVNGTPITGSYVELVAGLLAGDSIEVEFQWTVPALATPPATDSATFELAYR
ncbi:hypothetical protein [Deinococcus cellulosilyticus]|uniref:Uncharacterized protein n=1 Tax=Deinococcus cellulosilyticus (strain DSM 18568 / NBRC 106333 / KACC 11606 / 5516J-15) TaxID=1223518 RepID=A0A511N0C3_DEIC1|nr:hypothetical protein [Deinococcus cellulosilyticus]GEM45918.1 hypothetical protein DC3_15530 [Deinococcus cellulosilyticus NBRC 106333 = KACC 11606]